MSNTPSLVPVPLPQARYGYGTPQLELAVVGYTFNAASVQHSREGTTFAFTMGPISDATMVALRDVAEKHGRILLLFPQPLLLEFVTIERNHPQRVRIAGRVMEAQSYSPSISPS